MSQLTENLKKRGGARGREKPTRKTNKQSKQASDQQASSNTKSTAVNNQKGRNEKGTKIQTQRQTESVPTIKSLDELKNMTQSEKKDYVSQRKSTRRPATRSELRQAARVKKHEDALKKRKAVNRERFRKGKKVKEEPSTNKPSIWERIAEDKVYHQLRQMGDSTQAIDRWQRKRVQFALFVVLLGLIAGFFLHPWLYISGPILGFAAYKMKAKAVDTYYKSWKFERQLNFSKFTRLVIPYLKSSGGNTALYTVFNKILKRTDNEADKRNLYQLMGEMADNPTDIQPFLDFAERSSGTDMSYLFMSTIFDFQQSTFDTDVIDELGKLASEDMMNSIDEIIDFKLRRFIMFPTKVTMCSFILVAGLGVGMMIHNFKNISFSPAMINPTQQAEDAGADTTIDVESINGSGEQSAEDTEDVSAMTEWEKTIQKVASANDSASRKYHEISNYADGYNPSANELVIFEQMIIDEYKSGNYITNVNDDVYMLRNIFQSHVVKNQYNEDKDMYIVASNFLDNVVSAYRGTANEDMTAQKESEIDEALARLG